MVKQSKGRESRWVKCENHRVSRHIVDTVAVHGGVLHIEKLLGIRDRTKKTRKVNHMPHAWPFAQLVAFIRYKAGSAGIVVIEEDPPHTSQQCSPAANILNGETGPSKRLFAARPAAFVCTRT